MHSSFTVPNEGSPAPTPVWAIAATSRRLAEQRDALRRIVGTRINAYKEHSKAGMRAHKSGPAEPSADDATTRPAAKLHVLYPCKKGAWQRQWYTNTFFEGSQLVCYDAATEADVWRADVIVAAFANPHKPKSGFSTHTELFPRLGLQPEEAKMRQALRLKVLVHIDDEYGARTPMIAAQAEEMCRQYSQWGMVYRNYWSNAIHSFFGDDGAWRLGHNCTAPPAAHAAKKGERASLASVHSSLVDAMSVRCTEVSEPQAAASTSGADGSPLYAPRPVGWVPLGWSSNWAKQPQPMSSDELATPLASQRAVFVGFYGNEKYKLHRGRLLTHFSQQTNLQVNRDLGHTGFGRGNASRYVERMRDTTMSLQVAGLSTECYRMYEALDAGCVPILVDELGGTTTALEQYRFILRDAPFPHAAKAAMLKDRLTALRDTPAAVDSLQRETGRWWRGMLGALRESVASSSRALKACETKS